MANSYTRTAENNAKVECENIQVLASVYTRHYIIVYTNQCLPEYNTSFYNDIVNNIRESTFNLTLLPTLRTVVNTSCVCVRVCVCVRAAFATG